MYALIYHWFQGLSLMDTQSLQEDSPISYLLQIFIWFVYCLVIVDMKGYIYSANLISEVVFFFISEFDIYGDIIYLKH